MPWVAFDCGFGHSVVWPAWSPQGDQLVLAISWGLHWIVDQCTCTSPLQHGWLGKLAILQSFAFFQGSHPKSTRRKLKSYTVSCLEHSSISKWLTKIGSSSRERTDCIHQWEYIPRNQGPVAKQLVLFAFFPHAKHPHPSQDLPKACWWQHPGLRVRISSSQSGPGMNECVWCPKDWAGRRPRGGRDGTMTMDAKRLRAAAGAYILETGHQILIRTQCHCFGIVLCDSHFPVWAPASPFWVILPFP